MKRSTSRPRLPHLMEFLTSTGIAPFLLVGMTMIVYANSLRGEFVFDDRAIILRNRELLNVKELGEIFQFSDWRPPLYLTYGLNYYLGGVNPFGYHLLNVALHAFNSLIVFYILLEIEAAPWPALVGSALFAVHPLLTSAVSYVAGRSSVLCGTFYLLAIFMVFKGVSTSRLPYRWSCFSLAVLSAWLAWTTKQEAITLPLFLAAYFNGRSDTRNRYLALFLVLPLVVIIASMRQLSHLFTSASGTTELVMVGLEPALPLSIYLPTYLTALVVYVFPKFIVPAGLNVDPDIPTVAYSPEFAFSVFVLTGLIAAVILLKGKDRLLLRAGIAGILISPLAAYALMPLADVIQEHRIYIAGLGFALIGAWIAQSCYARFGVASVSLFGIWFVVFGIMTINRNHIWANSITLWEDAAGKSPQKARPHLNLGQAYHWNARFSDALREYEMAIRLKPSLLVAEANIGLVYFQQGNTERARQVLENVRKTAPSFVDGWSNLGMVYVRLGQLDHAVEVLSHAVELQPQSASALSARGDVFALKGEYGQAISDYNAALALGSDAPILRLRLGNAYMQAGNAKAAEEAFQGLAGHPTLGAEANRSIGMIFKEAGQYDKARSYFEKALQQRPVYPRLHYDLGIVFLHTRMPDRAIEEFQVSLTQAPAFEAAFLALAQAHQESGRSEQARQVLQEYVHKFGKIDSVYVREAWRRLHALR